MSKIQSHIIQMEEDDNQLLFGFFHSINDGSSEEPQLDIDEDIDEDDNWFLSK